MTDDPYVAVARELAAQPRTKAELKVMLSLDGEIIDAALTRFETNGTINKFRKGNEDHYVWKSDQALPSENYGQPRAKIATVAPPLDTTPAPTATEPRGFTITGAVRSFIDGLSMDRIFTTLEVSEALVITFPHLRDNPTAKPSNKLRTKIAASMNYLHNNGLVRKVGKDGAAIHWSRRNPRVAPSEPAPVLKPPIGFDYSVVIADLEERRGKIDAAINALRELQSVGA